MGKTDYQSVQENGTGKGFADAIKTILVIEDELTVRQMTERVLTRLGYRVLCAGDGEEGKRMFRDRCDEIDLVLLDMTLPVCPGEYVLASIREICPLSRIVVVSGTTEEEVRKRTAPHKCGILMKPYSVSDLKMLIDTMLIW